MGTDLSHTTLHECESGTWSDIESALALAEAPNFQVAESPGFAVIDQSRHFFDLLEMSTLRIHQEPQTSLSWDTSRRERNTVSNS